MNYGPASKYYDLFASSNDVDFYKELALEHGSKALELGVGTGRVAIELARAGVAVWGVDNSSHMLEVARMKLRKEPITVRNRVTLQFGDMRDFRLEEKFPIAYIPASTFEHCVTEEDQKRCLKSVRNLLEKRGLLAFDISQRSPEKPESSWWIDRRELGKDEVVRTIFTRVDPQTRIASVNLFFDLYRDGKLKERYHEYGEARISTKKEAEDLLEELGFEVERICGDFDGSPYSRRSDRMIFVAEIAL
jgi:cyclopropane fatty-acyl-phospholipid synthase-like methyltransferase